jgi:peptidoglycan/LPS O-acetylase OafA/YrhL
MIHCLVFPVVIAFAPAALKALPGDDVTHRTLAVGIGLAGVLAFRSGYKVHGRRWILALFLLGMALVSAGALIGEPALPALGEAAITVCGSVLLVTAHWCNRSLCHSCAASGCHQEPLRAPDQNAGDAAGVRG